MAKKVVKFDTYTFSFPITTSDEVCNEEWVSGLKSTVGKLNNSGALGSYYDATGAINSAKGLTTHEDCEIDGVLELSTIAQNILDDMSIYDEQINNCLSLIDSIIEEQKAKDEAIVNAYNKAEEAAEAYRIVQASLSEYNEKKTEANNDPENSAKANLRDSAYSQYEEDNKAYEAIVAEAKSLFTTAQGMAPTTGYDDLTMSG